MILPNMSSGLVGDADVVALGLAHLLHAVEADEDGHGHDDLRRLAVDAAGGRGRRDC